MDKKFKSLKKVRFWKRNVFQLFDFSVATDCGQLLWDVSVPGGFENYENTVQLGRILPKFKRNCRPL
jgi:hypothetical protein